MSYRFSRGGSSIGLSNLTVPAAKGGFIVGDGVGAPQELPVGNAGSVLVPDTNEATGVKWEPIVRVQTIHVFQATTNCSTGDGKWFGRVPSVINGWNLVAVTAQVYTAGTTGSMTIQVRRRRSGSNADMLSTKITLDSTEVDSSTAAPAVIDTANDDVLDGDILAIDVDSVHTTPAQGLGVNLHFQKP